MKTLAVAVAALLVGFVLGAWGPRADLRDARQELEGFADQAPLAAQPPDPAIGDVTRMLQIPKRASGKRTQKPAERTAGGLDPEDDKEDAKRPRDTEASRQSLEERIAEAAELWQMRVDVARNAFLNNTGLDENAATQFDVLVQAMNIRLKHAIQLAVDDFKEGDMPDTELSVRLVNDLTEAVVLTYDEMDRTLPGDWREGAGDDFELLDFVNPSVAMPLTEVQGQFNPGPPRSGDGGHRGLRTGWRR